MGCLALCAKAETPSFTVKTEKLGGSLIAIAEPKEWNGQVLLYAHGMRPAGQPLSASIDTDYLPYKTLLEEGWLVAMSSFRKNGHVVEIGVEDTEELRQHIVATYGKPKRTFLFGGSMGGDIAVVLAERFPEHYAGALSGDPALRSKYTHAPKIPVIFLCTSDELHESRQYIAKSQDAPVRPVLWFTQATGHCQYSAAEILTAMRGLITFADSGKCETEKDITSGYAPPASTATFEATGARAKIRRESGNLDTTFTREDFEKLRITQGTRFHFTVRGQTVNVFYGTDYNSVPKGEWVAFAMRDGYVRIARNSVSANAVLNCKVGDEAIVSPVSGATKE